MLHSIRQLDTDVSGEPIRPTFKGQAVQEECQEQWVHSYIQNGVGGDWFSESVTLDNRDTGA